MLAIGFFTYYTLVLFLEDFWSFSVAGKATLKHLAAFTLKSINNAGIVVFFVGQSGYVWLLMVTTGYLGFV